MRVATRPLLVYDGECSFCRRWAARWQRASGGRVDCAPYQEVAGRFPLIPRERFRRAVQLIEPDGRHFEGAEAVVRSLARAPGRGWLLWAYRFLPGCAPLARAGYRMVSRRFGRASR